MELRTLTHLLGHLISFNDNNEAWRNNQLYVLLLAGIVDGIVSTAILENAIRDIIASNFTSNGTFPFNS